MPKSLKISLTHFFTITILTEQFLSKNKFALILLFPFLVTVDIFSQANQDWTQRYSSVGYFSDNGKCIAVDNSGDVIVTGENSMGGGIVTIKYSNTGIQKWAVNYSGQLGVGASPYSLTIDSSNNIYITGVSIKPSDYPDLVTMKYSPEGILRWTSIYNGFGTSSDKGVSIKVDNGGFVYVGGYTSAVAYDYDFITIKYSGENGDSLWVRRFNEGGSMFDMTIDKHSNIYVTGRGVQGFCTIKYDMDGHQKWIVNSSGGSEPHAIAIDKLNNIYVTGDRYGVSTEFDCVTEKYDTNGIIKWSKIYNNYGVNTYDDSYTIAVDDSCNVLIGGYSQSINYNMDCLVIKYNSDGVQQWIARYDGLTHTADVINKIIIDKFGNSYVTGSSGSGSSSQYLTIKYSLTGIQQWIMLYHNLVNGIDAATDIALDSSDNIYVTGYSFAVNTYYDIETIKYSQTIGGINLINNNVTSIFKLYQNYPNPFNPTTTIKFDLPKSSNINLVIYDLLGRELYAVTNEFLKMGSYEVQWNAEDFPSAIYFYKLTAGDFTESNKMVLIK